MLKHAPDDFSDAERALVDTARRFREDVVTSNAEAWEAAREVPVDVFRHAAREGLLAIETPSARGGLGHRYRVKLAIAEELAQGDMGFAFVLINTQNVAALLAAGSSVAQRDEHIAALLEGRIFGATALTEPHAGSDFSAIRTVARRVNGGWILNGEKAWITNAGMADLFVTYAQTAPDAGSRGIGGFLVDARRAGFERSTTYSLMGGHTIGAGGFTLRDYFVPDEDLLAPPGEGFKQALAGVNGARAYVAALCTGMIASSLDTALKYGAHRESFGRPLIEHQGLRWSLADVANDMEALRGLAWAAGALIETGGNAVMAAAHAKKFAGRVTVPAVTACIQAMGAAGLRSDHPLGRHLACAKIAAFTDGSTEMMNERIGAGLIKPYQQAASGDADKG